MQTFVGEGAPKASIIIRAFNEGHSITQLFLGLRAQTVRDFDVILVDSGSTDDTVQIAQSFGANVVHLRKEEFSFGRALNRGCAAAAGHFFIFASAHVYPTRTDWIETLLAPFSDPRVALVYGKQRGNHITKFSEKQLFRQWFPDNSDFNQAHGFCNNANCAIRRDWWVTEQYDEALTGLEDLAWAKTVKAKGGTVVYSADAEIIHVHDETPTSIRNRYFREAVALRSIEPYLKFTLRDFCCLTMSNIIADLSEASKQGRLRAEAAGIFEFRFNQFVGTYMGHRLNVPLTSEMKQRFYYPPPPVAAVRAHSDEKVSPALVVQYQPTN